MTRDDDDLALLAEALSIVKAEREQTRELIKSGDRTTNSFVNKVGLFAVLLGLATTVSPLVFVPIVAVILGIAGGGAAGAAIFMQSRWQARRAILDDAAYEQDKLVLCFSETIAETQGQLR